MKNLMMLFACAVIAAGPMSAATSEPINLYMCPECGQDCDKLTFDKPGTCPKCGMTLIEKSKQKAAVTVAVLLFDGAQVIDYAGPWEAFGQAGFKIFSVAEKATPIKSVFGQTVVPDYTFAKSPSADILLVPGGSVPLKNPELVKWVQKNAQTSKFVMSVCTGAFILAKAGLLDGLSATTVSGAIDHLATLAPKTKVVSDQRYVDNGKIITTAGLSSGIDGAFHLISKIRGKGAAQATALGMEYRWDPDSTFARTALADRYFPEIDEVDADILLTDGDAEHWEFKALVSKPNSAAAIVDLLSKRIVADTPHAAGDVSLTPSTAKTSDKKSEIGWKFKDEQGRNWNGTGIVEPAADQPGKFVVTLKLARQQDEKTT
jgi:putative intracellular protease/amidase